jgi:hypothetical protein
MYIRILLPIALLSLPLAAQTKPAPTLADALIGARNPLILDGSRLSGPGAAMLTQAVSESQFVLVGEDHLTQQIPQFVSAICDAMHPDAYAVEAGPDAVKFVGSLLRSPNRLAQMAARSKAHPNNMAFLDIREENDLAAHCAAASANPQFELWGLDQEFVGSAGTLLESMKATGPGPKSLAAIAATQAMEQQSLKDLLATGNPGKFFLLASTDVDTQPLADAIAADGNAETQRLMREFTLSRTIYRLNADGSPDSNRLRAILMKRHFLPKYLALQAKQASPRVLFKFGDNHVGKGFNVLQQLDIGDFVAELADSEQAQSLHILVLGARGTHAGFTGVGKPLAHEPFVMTDDPDYKWLELAVADLLPQNSDAKAQVLTLFDLRKLRFHGIDFSPEWRRAVYGYDLLVLIPELTPASEIE